MLTVDLFGWKQLMLALALVLWLLSRQGLGQPGWLMTIQLASALAIELWTRKLALDYRPNLWLYSIAVPIEYGTLMGLAFACIRNKHMRHFLIIASLLFIGVYCAEQLSRKSLTDYVNLASLVGSMVLSISFIHLLFVLADDSRVRLHHAPKFWLFLSIVLYYGGMIPLNGMLETLSERDPRLADHLFIINDMLFFFSNCLLYVTSLLFRHQRSSSWSMKT